LETFLKDFFVGINGGLTVAGSTSDPGPFSYQLNSPTGIMVDQYGYLYILDDGNSRLQKWSPRGTFSDPLGMALNPCGNIYIADTNYHRIQSFSVWCRKFKKKI
jgi:DNA-binding beta-propeller fold protein YncE